MYHVSNRYQSDVVQITGAEFFSAGGGGDSGGVTASKQDGGICNDEK